MTPTGASPDIWRRFSPRQTVIRTFWMIVIVFIVVWSLSNLDITWIYLLDAHIQAGDLLTRMFPPDWGYTGRIMDPLLETIHIATLGTVVTFVISIPLAFLSASNTTPNWVTWFIGRFILVSSRSINTVVWALIFYPLGALRQCCAKHDVSRKYFVFGQFLLSCGIRKL